MSDQNDNNQQISFNSSMVDAKMFQELYVQPMVDKITTANDQHKIEITGIVQGFDGRVKKIESDILDIKSREKKAAIGYSIYATALAAAIGSAWGWLKAHFRVSL